jgi:NAD(P)-dependent dehydrogenase (short-subunit alcohol dehydrogenase family)
VRLLKENPMYAYQARPNLLQGRTILVTGAGRGIGAAAARCFAAHGARLLLLGKTESRLMEVARQIESAGHGSPRVLAFDLHSADPRDYQALAEQVQAALSIADPAATEALGDGPSRAGPRLEDAASDHGPAHRHGALDGLLHNASIIGPRCALDQVPGEDFIEVMQVNVNATFLLTQALLPLLKSAADPSVVFTSSSVGRKGRACWGAYGVSKFATEGLMQTLADELEGFGTARSNSINPGGTRTDMRALAYPDEDPARTPLPEDILPVYLYLLGPDSQGVNGQAFNAQ